MINKLVLYVTPMLIVSNYEWQRRENFKVHNSSTLNTLISSLILHRIEHSTSEEKEDFLEEMYLMKKLESNAHVIGMLGCCTKGTPQCIVLEYMKYGDLLHFLRDKRKKVRFDRF